MGQPEENYFRSLYPIGVIYFAFTLHQPTPAMPEDAVPDRVVEEAVAFLLKELEG